jgi:hypothetical protein
MHASAGIATSVYRGERSIISYLSRDTTKQKIIGFKCGMLGFYAMWNFDLRRTFYELEARAAI